MLSDLQPDIRKLLDLARKMENFDATLAAYRLADKPLNLSRPRSMNASVWNLSP